ncbi:MAG TPA: TetR family transcriptional regulator [Ktedonobacterales bacterium]|jgi:TetR/AcrR family transcriptional regulator
MVRGRERDAAAAREAIRRAAEEVFARDGFAGARVDAIAAAAGYNKALIFHYYGDKLGLYRAVVGRMKENVQGEFAAVLTPVVSGQATPPTAREVRAFIAGAVRWTFDYYGDHPLAARILAWEAAEGWCTFTMIKDGEGGAAWVSPVAAYLRRAQAAGIVRPDLDPVLIIANAITLTLNYHLAIPRYRLFFPGVDLDSRAALARAREQIVIQLLDGTLLVAPEV